MVRITLAVAAVVCLGAAAPAASAPDGRQLEAHLVTATARNDVVLAQYRDGRRVYRERYDDDRYARDRRYDRDDDDRRRDRDAPRGRRGYGYDWGDGWVRGRDGLKRGPGSGYGYGGTYHRDGGIDR